MDEFPTPSEDFEKNAQCKGKIIIPCKTWRCDWDIWLLNLWKRIFKKEK